MRGLSMHSKDGDYSSVSSSETVQLNCMNVNKALLLAMRCERLAACQSCDVRTSKMSVRDLALRPCKLSAKWAMPSTSSSMEGPYVDRTKFIHCVRTAETKLLKSFPDIPADEGSLLRLYEGSREVLDLMYDTILKNDFCGCTEQEIQVIIGQENERKRALEFLLNSGLVAIVGIHSARYVGMRFIDKWAVKSFRFKDVLSTTTLEACDPVTQSDNDTLVSDKDDKICEMVRFLPRPWVRPDGSLNRSMLRWCAEGIFFRILEAPGALETYITEEFSTILNNWVISTNFPMNAPSEESQLSTAVRSGVEDDDVFSETFVPAAAGTDRIKAIFTRDVRNIPSFEMSMLKNIGFGSFFVATLVGGTADIPFAAERFKSQHSYSLFVSQRDAASRLNNYMFLSFWRYGARLGFRCCYFSVAYLLVASLLAAYRNKLKAYDFIIGGAVSGAVYRCNMGLRGSLVTGLAGACLSAPLTLLFYSVLICSGYKDFDGFYKNCRQEYYRSAVQKKKEKLEIDFIKKQYNLSNSEAIALYKKLQTQKTTDKENA
ncbi:unnamed protein product [Soboliphyme baturini]|uniref:Complex I assembly factor TIMMDC1, mitochondrial n=1 Tax=Soboliphyme baturini TaxID=241478 RepID=A0A183IND9_9BILA|nr:unnamed protein product [Soboliphyme baturini]